MSEIDELLNEPDDEKLCRGVFARFAQRNNVIDVASCSEEERVVTLVLHASGIIGNGGFEYLFAGEFNGDPGLVCTAEAFKTIGASGCCAAFQRALGAFKGSYPSDAKRRLAVYREVPEADRNSTDRQFSDDKSIKPALARYIRQNRTRIHQLLCQPPVKKSFLERLFRL